MESPFDALHAGIESQILNLPAGIPDSQAGRQSPCQTPLKNFVHWGRLFPGSFATVRPLQLIRRG